MSAPVVHIPLLRHGRPYQSLDVIELRDPVEGTLVATVSQANVGLVERDLRRAAAARESLTALSTRALLDICAGAAQRFVHDVLPVGDATGATLGPNEYIHLLSASTGLPHALCRRNMEKIASVLSRMAEVIAGLTRGLSPELLDAGMGDDRGVPVCFAPLADALGVILPSNSPGVNALWLPAIALKVPVVLKCGRADPFTPNRIAAALRLAGCPPEAVSVYAAEHAAVDAIANTCGRTLLFGDAATVARHAANPRVQVHGPGYSKVLIGEDAIADWPRFVDAIVESIAANGGRSCVNASAVIVPSRADEIADAIASRLALIAPRPLQDPDAQLAGFSDRALATRLDASIDAGLAVPGAMEITAKHRNGPRLVEHGGLAYLLPTLVRCHSFAHPLANRELLFPYASVVEIPHAEMASRIGPTLAVMALTRDASLIDSLRRSPTVERLHVGPSPTSRVRWDQPHEGNLFELLYRRKAIDVLDW